MSASTLAAASDRSVTLTTASLQIIPPNSGIQFLVLQNNGPSNCWVNLSGGAAVANNPNSIMLPVNGNPMIFDATVPVSGISGVSASSSALTVMFSGPGLPPLEADGAAIGNSFTFAAADARALSDWYPGQLQLILNNQGANTRFVNYGQSGAGSGRAITQARAVVMPPRPTFALIYIGENDDNPSEVGTVQGGATATVIPLDAGKGSAFAAGGACFVGAEPTHVIQSISGDILTLAAPLSGAPIAGTQVLNDTQTNIGVISGVLNTMGFTKQVIGVIHYMNWPGGDTVTVQGATWTTVRAAQRAAGVTLAGTIGAVTADFYQFMRLFIVNGTVIQDSANWHVASGNVHLNNYGETILAQGVRSVMPPAWISAIT